MDHGQRHRPARPKAENITRIRATWQEDDGGYAGTFPLAPSITVESSPGKYHRYWLTDIPATEETRQQHRGVMGRMVESYGSDKAATDLSRVLRVPGFLHRKAAPFMVRIVEAGGYRYWWADILEAFPAPPRAEAKPHTAWQPRDDDNERIASALEHIPADDRATWLSVGMALQSHSGERGRDLWGRWSATSAKYDAADLDRVWRSFGKRSGTTIATLFHQAMQHGWEPPERLERHAWSTAGLAIRMLDDVDEAWAAFRDEHPEVPRKRAEFIFQTLLERELANGL
jgi:hypothetical protein